MICINDGVYFFSGCSRGIRAVGWLAGIFQIMGNMPLYHRCVACRLIAATRLSLYICLSCRVGKNARPNKSAMLPNTCLTSTRRKLFVQPILANAFPPITPRQPRKLDPKPLFVYLIEVQHSNKTGQPVCRAKYSHPQCSQTPRKITHSHPSSVTTKSRHLLPPYNPLINIPPQHIPPLTQNTSQEMFTTR